MADSISDPTRALRPANDAAWHPSLEWIQRMTDLFERECERLPATLRYRLGRVLIDDAGRPWRWPVTVAAILRIALDERSGPPELSVSPPHPLHGGEPSSRAKAAEIGPALARLARARRDWEVQVQSRAFRAGSELTEEGLRGIAAAFRAARQPPELPCEKPRIASNPRHPVGSRRASSDRIRCVGPDWWREMLGFEQVGQGAAAESEGLVIGIAGAADASRLSALDAAKGAVVWLLDEPLSAAVEARLNRARHVFVADPDHVAPLSGRLTVPVTHLPPAVAPMLDNPIGWFSGRPDRAVHAEYGARPEAWERLARMARGLDVTDQDEAALGHWLGEAIVEASAPDWVDAAEASARRRVARLRQAIEGHSLARRISSLEEALSLDRAEAGPERVSAVFSSRRRERHDDLLRTLAGQAHPNLLVVGVLHGDKFDDDYCRQLQDCADALGLEARLTAMSSRFSLGECLQAAFDDSEGTCVVRLDDDDWYGRHYVGDMALAFSYSEAGLVYKRTHVVDRRDAHVMALRFPDEEFLYAVQIAGGNRLALRRDLLRDIAWRRTGQGEDVALTYDCVAAGAPPLAIDRYNHALIRRADGRHTWDMAANRHLDPRYVSRLPVDARIEDFEV